MKINIDHLDISLLSLSIYEDHELQTRRIDYRACGFSCHNSCFFRVSSYFVLQTVGPMLEDVAQQH